MKDSYRAIPSKISSLRHDMNGYLVQKMRDAGWKEISPSHGGIIYALLTYEVLAMKEIAEKVKRDPSTVTTLVNKLVKLGYAEYTKHPYDLRSKQVRLTLKGKELYDDFHAISIGFIDTLLNGLTDEEIDIFISVTEKMNKNVERKIE